MSSAQADAGTVISAAHPALAVAEATYTGVLVASTYPNSLKAAKMHLSLEWKFGSGLRKQTKTPSLSPVERW